MKKIILSSAVILAVVAVVVTGTGAFFGDSETSTGNVFTAGALDLKVDNTCHYYQNGVDVGCENNDVVQSDWEETDLEDGVHKFFWFDDIKPGDHGEDTISLHVYNNDAWGWFSILNWEENDNSCTEPEEYESNDSACGLNEDGELDDAVLFTAWLDQGSIPGFQNGDKASDSLGWDATEGDNIHQPQDEPLIFTDVTVNDLGPFPLDGILSDAYDECSDTNVNGHNNYDVCHGLAEDGRMVASTTYYFGLAWKLPLEVGNEVQTDSFGGDMSFHVVQHRNNPDKVGGPQY